MNLNVTNKLKLLYLIFVFSYRIFSIKLFQPRGSLEALSQVLGCVLFSIIIYVMSGQPLEINRFTMFTAVSLLVVFIAQSIGFMIGAIFNIVVSLTTD